MGQSANTNGSVTLEQLLEEAHWIRGLALYLLRDENLADDVVQQTFVAWLRSPPRDPKRLRPWLRQVVRNFVRRTLRDKMRRDTREKRAARQPIVEREDLTEADELKHRVAEAVIALEEPYRSSIVQHFYEQLSAREIARREGVPSNTVLVRIRRAMGHLRRSLDRYYNGRRKDWVVGLIVFAGGIGEVLAGGVDLEESDDFLEDGHEGEFVAPGTESAGSVATTATRVTPRVFLAAAALMLLTLVGVQQLTTFGAGEGAAESGTAIEDALAAGGPNEDGNIVGASFRGGSSGAALIATSDTTADVAEVGSESFAVEVIAAETGRPIAGAEVYLVEHDTRSENLAHDHDLVEFLTRRFAAEPVARTDEGGIAEVPRRLLERARIAVCAPGFQEYREDTRTRALAATAYRVLLAPATDAVVEVVEIVDDVRRSIPNVHVEIRSGGETLHEALTDDEGKITYTVGCSAATVVARADGYATVSTLATTPHQQITLVAGAPATGIVRDLGGRGVGGATVEVFGRPSWRGAPYRTVTASDGSFTTMNLPMQGAIHVRISHPEFASSEQSVALPWQTPRDFALAEGAIVHGEVLGPKREILTDGRVFLFPVEGSLRLRRAPRAEIADDGTFRIESVPAGSYVLVTETGQWLAPELPVPELVAGEERFVGVRLARGTTVTGQVLTTEGVPAAGVRLRIGEIYGDEVVGKAVTTDARGTFEASGLPAQPAVPRAVRSDELRWEPLFTDGAPNGAPRELLLEVQAPHQLVRGAGEEIPHTGIYGSRNTCGVSPGSHVELVVADISAQPRFSVRLADENGDAITTVTNLIVIPPEDPTDFSVTFAGVRGNPRNLRDGAALDGCLVGFWTRRYATRYELVRFHPDFEKTVVLEPLRPRRLRLVDLHGAPRAGEPLFVVPELEDHEPFAAVLIGTTDTEGFLQVNDLCSGVHRFYVVADTAELDGSRAGLTVLPIEQLIWIETIDLLREVSEVVTLKH